MSEFREEIEHAINRHSKENGSNTPDFLLANYLLDCLDAFDRAISAREKWYGRTSEPGSLNLIQPEPEAPSS